MSVASRLVLGFLLGLKHAIDADHVAAIATIVSERGGALRASWIGAWWGVGHGLALLPVAVAVIFLHLEIGPQLAVALEIGVAAMLIALAGDSLRKLPQDVHLHRHGAGIRHLHPHPQHGAAWSGGGQESSHQGVEHRLAVRPVLIGLAHGLAGSAAVMLLVAASIPEPSLALLFVALFALGSTVGMVLMGLVLGGPFGLAVRRWSRADRLLRGAAGGFSLIVGLSMLYQLVLRGV